MSNMFRPPVNRAMLSLDRSFFKSSHKLAAARIFNRLHISQIRKQLEKSQDILSVGNVHVNVLRLDPPGQDGAGSGKCILLKPAIKHDDKSTWSNTVQDLVQENKISLISYNLQLNYEDWPYADIMDAILPEEYLDDRPTSFSSVGHVAHLNLRERFLPYKHLIAAVITDKNKRIKTVINKLDNVGDENAFRTFRYEVLDGPDDLNVEVKEQGCIFAFDYAKVYWNSRLHTEHERLVGLFKEGEAVCDVMAGIGPFAIPAAKKKCFVWANDLNPASYDALEEGIRRNKVHQFARPFNMDGGEFIRRATNSLFQEDRTVSLPVRKKPSRTNPEESAKLPPPIEVKQPKLFSRFVMNLPASALKFLPAFVGLYSQAKIPPGSPLPKIHVYCFSSKSEDISNRAERLICEEISQLLKFEFKPGSEDIEGEVDVYDVRDVAPKKRMFCATFTLPEKVAHFKE